MASVLIADMCYHQVMAESIYYPLKKNGTAHLLLSEANFELASDIDPSDAIIFSQRSDKTGPIKRRIIRIGFLFELIKRQAGYSHVIMTAGIEYIPSGVKWLWYLLMTIACIRKQNIIFVVHDVRFWKLKKRSIFYGPLFKIILQKADQFACLSQQVLCFWRDARLSNRQNFIIPFLTIHDTLINKYPIDKKDKIRVVVQGTVCMKRKRYDHLAYVMDKLPLEKKEKIIFVFQGPPVSLNDKKMLQEFTKKANVEWRENYLTNEAMHLLVNSCDIFFAPLNAKYGYGDFRESGIGFDCIKYQRGAIAQSGMCSDEFKEMIINYNDEEDLVQIMSNLNFEKIKVVYKNVVDLSKAYSHSYLANSLKMYIN